jgi:hypothetical protein
MQKEIIMGAPLPGLVDPWLARAFNAQDVEAAASTSTLPTWCRGRTDMPPAPRAIADKFRGSGGKDSRDALHQLFTTGGWLPPAAAPT